MTPDPQFILVTTQGAMERHAYGPMAEQDAQNLGTALAAASPPGGNGSRLLSFDVVRLDSPPPGTQVDTFGEALQMLTAQALLDLYVIPQDGVTDATDAMNRFLRLNEDAEMKRAVEALRAALGNG